MLEIDGEPAAPGQLAALALYGYGHFTSLRVDDGRVRGLSLHLERLVHDCRALFDAELDVARVRRLLRRAADRGRPGPTLVRVTAFAPDLQLSHPAGTLEPRLLVSSRAEAGGQEPPLRVRSVRYQRDLPGIKHVGLFGTVHHRRLAQQAGFDDVLFVDASGRVSEGATWNIGFLDQDRLIWPQADYLPGVTMRLVTELAATLGVPGTVQPVGPADLPRMRAAFATNAAVGLQPVAAVDDVSFDPATALVERLQEAYRAAAGELL